MKKQKGQAATEWVFMMSIVAVLAVVVLVHKNDNGRNFSDMIRGWYLGAGQIIASAGIKK